MPSTGPGPPTNSTVCSGISKDVKHTGTGLRFSTDNPKGMEMSSFNKEGLRW